MEEKESKGKWIGLGILIMIVFWLFISFPVVMAELSVVTLVVWCLANPQKKKSTDTNGKEKAAEEHEEYLAEVNKITKEKAETEANFIIGESTDRFYAQAEESAEFVDMGGKSWEE